MPENNGTKRVSRRKFVKGAAGGAALLTTPHAATGQGRDSGEGIAGGQLCAQVQRPAA